MHLAAAVQAQALVHNFLQTCSPQDGFPPHHHPKPTHHLPYDFEMGTLHQPTAVGISLQAMVLKRLANGLVDGAASGLASAKDAKVKAKAKAKARSLEELCYLCCVAFRNQIQGAVCPEEMSRAK